MLAVATHAQHMLTWLADVDPSLLPAPGGNTVPSGVTPAGLLLLTLDAFCVPDGS